MASHKGVPSRSFVWPLIKAAGFWFLFAEAALLIAPTADTSPQPFVYFAAAAFGIQSVRLLLGSLMAYGFSWRLGLYAAACVAVAIGICSMLPTIDLNGAASADRTSRRSDRSGGNPQGAGSVQQINTVRPVESLSGAAELVFGKETEESLAEARRYLLTIPERSQTYKSAQALLGVIENRLDEISIRGSNAPIEIVAFEQTARGLRITLRNNSSKYIRNIRYRVAYFAVADGRHMEPDTESLLAKDMPPRFTATFELPKDSAKGNVYASFTVLSWDDAPTRTQ
jgi:hypothetical protein